MFKLATKRRVTWPVTISIPQDGGSVRRERFEVEFEMIDIDEQQQIINTNGDLLDRQVVGWPRGPKGEDDQPVAFSEEAKKKLLSINYARNGIFEALGELNSGRAAARKN